MQRLYSMFPAGAPGIGLLVLRICSAGMFLTAAVRERGVITPVWELVGVSVLALLPCLGIFTPVFCSVIGLIEIASLRGLSVLATLQQIFAILVTASLLMLGPGAFSLDARIFGRRIIIVPNK